MSWTNFNTTDNQAINQQDTQNITWEKTFQGLVLGAWTPDTEGELLWNWVDKNPQYYDGTNVIQIVWWTAVQAGNAWQVKILDGNWVTPQFVFVWWGGSNLWVFQQVTYASPLWLSPSPTTTRPANITSPTDADIYDFVNDTFIENTVLWQVHQWRVNLQYSGKSSWQNSGISIKLENTISWFIEETLVYAASATTSGHISVILNTIADGDSLPAPFGTWQWYEISVTAYDPMTIDVDSVTRISLAFW